jgi:drug/metabolite transporter (DMT)-like permease
MILFILCLIVAVTILVVFRLFEKFGIDNLQAILFSYLISALAAFLVFDWKISLAEIPQQDWFIYTFIIGTSFFIGFNIFALSTQKAGLALTSVAANISVIIPVSIALLLYGEEVNSWQIGGLILALASIFLVFKPKDKAKFSIAALLFPMALFFINGINNSLMKHVEHLNAMNQPMLFLGLVFVSAFLGGLFFYFF